MWLDLLDRSVSGTAPERLSSSERTVFFAMLLQLEVLNGGFYQFFFNSSGTYLAHVRDALMQLGATSLCQLLDEAAARAFAADRVPEETAARRALLQQRTAREEALVAQADLEAAYQSLEPELERLLERIARGRGLLVR